MMNPKTSTVHLQDVRVNIKLRLCALWASLGFCYVFGDFLKLSPIDTTQLGLLSADKEGVELTSILVAGIMASVPPLMISVSLTLSANVCRWVQITAGILLAVITIYVTSTSGGKWMSLHVYFGGASTILTVAIVWLAWNWPRQETLGYN